MHVFTHLKKESEGKTGLGVYPDGMVEHDGHVGQLLAKLDELGIADNTIVMYSTDNGAEELSWPDGGATPFRGEKDTNWEGGWRVPCAIRWPGVIKPGTVYNEVFSHQDMLPTLLAAAGEPDIVEKVKKGHQAGAKTFKVHLDGFNLTPFFKGETKENPRPGFLYWSDEGDLMALRYGDWKVHFIEQRARRRAGVAGAVRAFEAAEALQFAQRPVRERGHRLPDVLHQVARRPHLLVASGHGPGPAVSQDAGGVPPEATARTLDRRGRARKAGTAAASSSGRSRREGEVGFLAPALAYLRRIRLLVIGVAAIVGMALHVEPFG